ncbi:MAG TPA: peptidase M14 [Planctomycetes bacterium]|nr:peptidase M14 [Planctomycetota bacterium]
MKLSLSCLLVLLLGTSAHFAQQTGPGSTAGFPGLPAGRAPRVEIPFNRLYPGEELYAHFDRLVAAYPDFLSMQVIGHSVENREMRVYTLNAPGTGADREKPAMWVDGNVHGNEVQGGEGVLYLAWYLLENYGTNERITDLLDSTAFYLLPTVNPDGRANWFEKAHNPHSSRSGVMPLDRDRDGLFDEDGPDDLDGDGSITQMRKYVPGEGDWRLNPDDPRVMERVPPNDRGIRGDWILLGQEGIDNDGDGRVNEDGVGGYDMNRAWPALWMPDHVQYGAGPYPLYWPEARCIARFLLDHPNVAAVQSYHNAGGMILRGPGAEAFGSYPRRDVAVYDALGKDGEKMLPFYRYMVIWKDLYSVFGGFVNWTYERLGILSFTNELWTEPRMSPDGKLDGVEDRRHWFDDNLLMGAGFVDWHPYEHPLYGEIEIGGFRKDVGRVPPTFLIEEMLHRNAAFCIRHAEAMPRVVIEEPSVTELGDELRAIDVVIRNEHLIPTRMQLAVDRHIGEPDLVLLEGEGIEVLAGGFRSSRFRPEEIQLQDFDPARLVRDAGIGSRAKLRVRWIVRGSGTASVSYVGEKVRDVVREFEL